MSVNTCHRVVLTDMNAFIAPLERAVLNLAHGETDAEIKDSQRDRAVKGRPCRRQSRSQDPHSPCSCRMSRENGDGGDHTHAHCTSAPRASGAGGSLLDLTCLSSSPPAGAGAWLPPRTGIQQPWAVAASGHVSRTSGPFLPARERAA